jgi:hypothetical protein
VTRLTRAGLAAGLAVCLVVVALLIGALMVTLPPPDCARNANDAAGVAAAQAAAVERGLRVLCIYDDYGRLREERHLTIPARTPVPTLDTSEARNA